MNSAALYALYSLLAALAAGIWLMIPAERTHAARLQGVGLILAAAGLGGLAVYLAEWIGSAFIGHDFVVVFAMLAIIAAIRVVTHHRPVYSAVYLVVVVLAVAGLCVLAGAEFLAAALVIVYGGAILVTYVFVIMLARQGGQVPYDSQSREPLASVVMGFALMAGITRAMVSTDPMVTHAVNHAAVPIPHVTPAAEIIQESAPSPPKPAGGVPLSNVRGIGLTLIGQYMLAVQVAGILLLVAMAGALAIARKHIDPSQRTEHELSQESLTRRFVIRGRDVEPFAPVGDDGERDRLVNR